MDNCMNEKNDHKNCVTKKQHYVPQFLLKNFTPNGESIFCYDKIENRISMRKIDNVACENYFYETTDRPVNEIENKLSTIEGKTSLNIQKIVQNNTIRCL